MKRSPMPRGTKPLARRAPIGAGKPKTQLPKVNARQQAKRALTYRALLAAYRKSETYRIVKARAAGQCEFVVRSIGGGAHVTPPRWLGEDGATTGVRFIYDDVQRCQNTGRLEHHHVKYPSVAGGERPADVVAGCHSCHAIIEYSLRPWKRNGGTR